MVEVALSLFRSMRRRALASAIALAFLLPLSEVASTPASAGGELPTRIALLQPVGVKFVDQRRGRCLDSNAQGSVYTLACNTGNYQNWIWNGSTLVDEATNLCLDSNAGGSVYTLHCNGGQYQDWNLDVFGWCPGTVSDSATARNLDSNSQGNVYTLPNNCGANQLWSRYYFQL